MKGAGAISGSSRRAWRPPTGNPGGRSERGSGSCGAAPMPSSRWSLPRWHCAGGSVCSPRPTPGRCERRWPAPARPPSSNAGCPSPLPSPSRRASGPRSAERQELPLEEPEEALLIRPDLVDRHVVEAGLAKGADGVGVGLEGPTADHNPCHVLLPERLGRLLEVARERKLLANLAGDGGDGADGMRDPPSLLLDPLPAHLRLAH